MKYWHSGLEKTGVKESQNLSGALVFRPCVGLQEDLFLGDLGICSDQHVRVGVIALHHDGV